MNTMKLAAIALMLLANAALAENNFAPADFGADEKALGKLIEFPELRGDTAVTVSCIAIVESNGRFDQHGCFQQNPGDQTFIGQIYKVAKKARLRPAVYNGKNVDVVFQYRVHFEKKGEDEILRLMANPGYEENVNAYSVDHIAAQRLMGKESWKTSCPQQTRFLVLARANVDWEGRPSAVTITHVDGIPITMRCEEALTQAVLDSRFIPAFADGEPVPSTFIEPFGN